jgi:transposase
MVSPLMRSLTVSLRYETLIVQCGQGFCISIPLLRPRHLLHHRLSNGLFTTTTMPGMPFRRTIPWRAMTPTTARNAHHDKKQNPSYPTLLHVILLRSRSPSMVDALLGGGADLDFAYVSSEDLPSIAATYLHLCNTTPTLMDVVWRRLACVLPPTHRTGRPGAYERRLVWEAMVYGMHNDWAWRTLPARFPPWQTAYAPFPGGRERVYRRPSGQGWSRPRHQDNYNWSTSHDSRVIGCRFLLFT